MSADTPVGAEPSEDPDSEDPDSVDRDAATPGDDGAADDADPVLSAEGLEKHFEQSDGFLDRLLGTGGTVKAVDGVDLEVREGETLAVVGESGCGKSTLGQALLNLHRPTDGTVRYRGEEITGLSGSAMRPYRRHLQMVFQDPLASLNPRKTVGDIVIGPMEVHDEPSTDPDVTTTAEVRVDGAVTEPVAVSVDDDVDRAVGSVEGVAAVDVEVGPATDGEGIEVDLGEAGAVLAATVDRTADGYEVRISVDASTPDLRRYRAGALLERVGLERGHLDRYPSQFSGGQQQRVGIARALAVEPDLIVADEPVSALDVSVQAQILNLLEELQTELGLSLLFISHDLSVVRQVADRVAVMYLGEIVETAPVDELFAEPRHPYTKSLLSAVPRIDPGDRSDRTVLRGSVPSPIDPPAGCRFHTRCPEVIPGAGWDGDQESFRRAFSFRTRVESGELEPDAVRDRLEAESDASATDETVAARLLETALPGAVDAFPAGVTESLREAGRLVAAGEDDDAAALLRETCPSPCVDEAPRTVETVDAATVACHRVDPDAPGEERVGD
ncbi:ATP-binding cassette domain-containing protein [Halobaculum sp. WSA2]|uniref:ATP-binding cassette domain-containing protein n=1 Tax=Halobaculum saliterrae TaxID=2073113 RepID=A0A6B0SM77_9EURY|nr:oligopeptide/dipeptide ABC transporter ATP-binding protein [Halobaculum saliterrae]MXR39984.1 ATP-binding cassette domain-containing protein [Halobaculum saliterrae]